MSASESILFEPWRHGTLTLRNRVVMAPMTRRMAAEDGIPTPEMAQYYARRAAHGVGLIISEGTCIDGQHAWDTLTVPRFETADQLEGWRRVVDAVHAAGGAFAPQLWHTGPHAAVPIGPSAMIMPGRKGRPARTVREMTTADMGMLSERYAGAARAAREIGCDALELHGAHGYLLDSFLSSVHNRRTDDYGGSFDRRMRFPLEIVRAVRAAVGSDYPIIYRFSQWRIDDFEMIKFANPDELGVWCRALREAGVDILHASSRDATAPAFPVVGKRTLAGWARTLSGIPVIAVGKITATLTMDQAYGDELDAVTDPAAAIGLLDNEEADLLAIGRPLIANADWVEIVRAGRWRDLIPFDRHLLQTLS